jgi:hypothetical protein
LTVFHAIELLLKERLAQTNPILIYKNIDAKITDDAVTVGVREALTRLENLGLGIPDEEKKTIENIQRVRNRIEHHRYDHNEKEDDAIIASSLKFILYFVEFVFEGKLDHRIDPKLLRDMPRRPRRTPEGHPTRRKADPCAERAGRISVVGPSELFDRSGTSTPVRTTTSPSMASSAVGPNAAQHQRAVVTPRARARDGGTRHSAIQRRATRTQTLLATECAIKHLHKPTV